ncbi:uncharacterized protein LOC131607879 [Vicia villosa]|uniref:uncharacterized protein LOC131607879 n=1 Tax=Vicia villosa TaxID=3911 RepID=UPI00273BF724|nr:uncharacterized protein LOC131607879 [Vicia villosa]
MDGDYDLEMNNVQRVARPYNCVEDSMSSTDTPEVDLKQLMDELRLVELGVIGHVDFSMSSTDTPKFDDKIKKQMMDALRVRDQGENIIGLCGPRKMVEAFVKTVIRRAERDQLFEKIVTATVTKKPDITNIQMQIGDAIGLNFDDKTDVAESTCFMFFRNSKNTRTVERASLLCAKMKELQTVLVVLYDLHGRLDLGEIGIPFGEDHNGCKILLASTNLEVLSKEMKVHKLIQLSET